jgi:hypothetical protein
MSDRLFEKTLLLPAGGGPTSETNEQILAALPSFLQDGVYKALRLASHVRLQPEVPAVEKEAEAETADQEVHATEVPASSIRLKALCGFLLSKPQLLWLFAALGSDITEVPGTGEEDTPISVVETVSDSTKLLSQPLTLLHMC